MKRNILLGLVLIAPFTIAHAIDGVAVNIPLTIDAKAYPSSEPCQQISTYISKNTQASFAGSTLILTPLLCEYAGQKLLVTTLHSEDFLNSPYLIISSHYLSSTIYRNNCNISQFTSSNKGIDIIIGGTANNLKYTVNCNY